MTASYEVSCTSPYPSPPRLRYPVSVHRHDLLSYLPAHLEALGLQPGAELAAGVLPILPRDDDHRGVRHQRLPVRALLGNAANAKLSGVHRPTDRRLPDRHLVREAEPAADPREHCGILEVRRHQARSGRGVLYVSYLSSLIFLPPSFSATVALSLSLRLSLSPSLSLRLSLSLSLALSISLFLSPCQYLSDCLSQSVSTE